MAGSGHVRATRPTTLVGSGPVVALRRRQAIGLGALADRALVDGDRLVSAHDAHGHSSWIPAEAVWSDADGQRHPENPRPIGLATAADRESALIRGLSDRLGWEAMLEFERGRELPMVTALGDNPLGDAIVLDGRLGHDVPTVIVLGTDTMRWGAASTWSGAVRRALYGDVADGDAAVELGELCTMLGAAGLRVAAVDLGTDLLRSAGIVRCSVQLVGDDAPVRPWDADRVN